MKILNLSILATLLLSPLSLNASNVLGDAKGESSLYLQPGMGSVTSNFKDKNVKFSYTSQSTNQDKYFWGITLEGSTTDNKSIIFDGGDFLPKSTISVPFTIRDVFYSGNNDEVAYDDLIIDIKYTVAEYSMFDSSLPFDDQLFTEESKVTTVTLAYNVSFSGNTLLGLSAERTKANNYSDLPERNVITTTPIGTSGSSTRIAESTKNAREGTFKEFNQTKVNFDAMYYPEAAKGRIAVSLFIRHDDNDSKDKSFTTPGIGIFLTKENEPTNIQAGVTYQKDDETDDGLIGVVAGYHF